MDKSERERERCGSCSCCQKQNVEDSEFTELNAPVVSKHDKF